MTVEGPLREHAPRVLAVLLRRFGDFDTCEDAVQEALLAAAVQWPADGVPANPTGWLVTVASRRWTEMWRSNQARQRREVAAATQPVPGPVSEVDDTLALLLLCCHPALTQASQLALTVRAVGGLNTAEIARALLVPEATVAQRISRAKQRIKASEAQFRMPAPDQVAARLSVVLTMLYLIFNEGCTASAGPALYRVELSAEAIRLARQLHERLPDDGEVTGLLALMLLTDARRPARIDPGGVLIPLTDQDRRRWDAAAIAEGVSLITRSLATTRTGPYQLQAAIAAVHDQAARPEDTDWPQILTLYNLLHAIAPSPMVTLNRIVALAMVHGPRTDVAELAADTEPALAGHYRIDAARAHLLELAGERDSARTHYQQAARRTLSVPEQRYLQSRAARI
jgi:RNA polymerase sigma factor (sigma-70 family)